MNVKDRTGEYTLTFKCVPQHLNYYTDVWNSVCVHKTGETGNKEKNLNRLR